MPTASAPCRAQNHVCTAETDRLRPGFCRPQFHVAAHVRQKPFSLSPVPLPGEAKIPFFCFTLPIGSLLTKPRSTSPRPPLASLCPRPPEQLPERRRCRPESSQPSSPEPTAAASSTSPTAMHCSCLLFH
jgi:hypothetical protein